ncbi:hypothetical protein BB8028_0002g16920 [Beauveria bassiana]|uniref:Uncharacterized protein n=1 Tax=Beauveria bassiana TaxID=176275 RepID=A0A2S7Y5Q8_BEABA|nr:hypothetical protein BB8028_0002g16920 [Beauveria bassiana]
MPLSLLERSPRVHSFSAKGQETTTILADTVLAQDCIRGDVITYFLDTWEVTLANWMLLLHRTALPEDGIDNAQQMSTAVNALESVIAGQELIPAKFGYLQLAKFLDALESRIQLQKDKGEECKGKSAATIAFDRYLALQGLQGKKHGKDALSYKRK